jgi:uncharacterized membrane protein
MASAFHVYFGPDALRAPIRIRKIGPADGLLALREGLDDFLAMPTHPAFIGVFYALAGAALIWLTSFANALHLVFPLASGFALVGPFVAVGLYEMSRRRERGLPASWTDGFTVARSPALPSVVALGLLLFIIFAAWIAAAQLLYVRLYGPRPPQDAIPFIRDVLTTSRGWTLIVAGGIIGLGFAALSLCLSVVSFPLLLDRDIGLVPAIDASVQTARENPGAVALWGLIVAVMLILGTLLLFIGLAIAMPILGHATWRFYRRAIVREPEREVPIDESPRPNLAERPLLRPIWISLDLFEFIRRGRL